jgi:formylglycine-generating enzyme required for sulfatase activity/serine/threonine protein kinase
VNEASPSAIDVFARWISDRQRGRNVEFAEILRRHPDLARELLELQSIQERGVETGHTSLARRSVLAEIAERFGEEAVSKISLREPGKAAPGSTAASARIAELAARGKGFGRYDVEDEIARGGMGAILRVWDEDLRRHLAMKVALVDDGSSGRTTASPLRSRAVARFLEEAQVTGQLDHPGIVPVHELGLDAEGRLYFTMKLVKGRDLRRIYDLVFAGEEGWSETRALGVVLKACEALAYAHRKGVIHRDLKPANVMVGGFGEVFVMDWGLARVLGHRDAHDIRLDLADAPSAASAITRIETDRREEREGTPDSPLVTMEGDVVGTPAYMPPEQARGEVESLTPRSDVYSIGAMLYHLLARQMPFVPPGERATNRTVLARVLEGPPRPLHEIRRDAPAELVAICEKAMARASERRYADTLALAEDLRAYLEHRVVAAYETGNWAETRKWVQRNKPLAASLAAGVLALVAGLAVSLSLGQRADENARLARTNEARAVADEAEAKRQEGIAKANAELAEVRRVRAEEDERTAKLEKANVLRLSAFQTLDDLTKEADELWPAEPRLVDRCRAWLDRAEKLEARIPEFRESLAELEKRALPRVDADRANEGDPPTRVAAGARAGTSTGPGWRFADEDDRWWHAELEKLLAALSEFGAERTGLMRGCTPEHGWGVAQRFEFAAAIAERSVSGPEVKALWEQARSAIAVSPKYGGLKLAPQTGLVPIGPDHESGLWEFAHLQTGDPAQRGAEGKLVVTESMGLVFVLIPGGSCWLGAQSTDPAGRNYDPAAHIEESPVQEVELSPYFLSKYEMTQGQWQRLAGRNPSYYPPGHVLDGHLQDLRHPVENVTWLECTEMTRRLGLALPTEAQWENGCRGGTNTPWWTGRDRESLRGRVNLADRSFVREGGLKAVADDWPDLDDGWAVHAAVGTFAPNAFGLHEVHGNVFEWCLDAYRAGPQPERTSLDPVSRGDGSGKRAIRGGCFVASAADARSAYRFGDVPESRLFFLGLRPAREIAP